MKKLLSVLMAFILLFTATVPAFASQGCDCGKTPLVIVDGMNVFPLIRNQGTPDEQQIWAPNIDMNRLVPKAVYGLAMAALFRDWNKLGDVIVPEANALLEPASCDANGDSKYNVTTRTFPKSMAYYPDFAGGGYSEQGLAHTACDALGKDHVYVFNYDWRIDPLVNAQGLNQLIQTALTETGHKKVNLAVCSLGANQALAYLAKYGSGSIEHCVFLSSAFGGSLVASEVFTKQLEINKYILERYVDQSMDTSSGQGLVVDLMLNILDAAGILDAALNLADSAVKALVDRAFDEVLTNLVTIPGFWALIREDQYETAKNSLLDTTVNANLIARIDDFHYNVRVKRAEIINKMMDEGVIVAFCSHYNKASLPVFPSAVTQSDGLVETPCTSGGATCAPLGQTFPEGYTQKNLHGVLNYVSADRVIDASTCMFPKQVWFFRNIPHVACPYNSQYNAFVMWLLNSTEQPTVWTDARYPQFMTSYDGGETLIPTPAVPADTAVNYGSLAAIVGILSNLLKVL